MSKGVLEVVIMARNDKDIALFAAYEDIIPWDAATPEKNLLRAMLITAMADFKKKGKVRRLAHEYFSNTNDSYPFSFRSVCRTLDVSPEDILRRIGMLEAQKEEPPHMMTAELAQTTSDH